MLAVIGRQELTGVIVNNRAGHMLFVLPTFQAGGASSILVTRSQSAVSSPQDLSLTR
jgi:hypothetical protein